MKHISYFVLIMLLFSCSAVRTTQDNINVQAPVIIYRTVNDYYNNVPIMLNEKKDRVISYPAPSDLVRDGHPTLPIKLANGYLLDLRGLGKNSAFTKYTYEDYTSLDAPPSTEELLNSIIDKDPFESLYNCGKRGIYNNLEKELNKKIRHGLKDCKLLK